MDDVKTVMLAFLGGIFSVATIVVIAKGADGLSKVISSAGKAGNSMLSTAMGNGNNFGM